jgi:hypothetical protein
LWPDPAAAKNVSVLGMFDNKPLKKWQFLHVIDFEMFAVE